MRPLLATAFAAALATSAQAATFDVALTQDGVGDAGPDWFGTVEADAFGVATSTSFLVDGVSYDTISSIVPLGVIPFSGTFVLTGFVLSEPLSSSSQTVLQFYNIDTWAFSSCDVNCGGGSARAGTYAITETTTPVVPLPATGWFLLVGLGGLAALRRSSRAAAV